MLRILLPLTSQITISYPGCYVLRPPLSPLAPRAAKRHYLSHPWQNQYGDWLRASLRTPSCFLRPISPSAAPTSQATTRSRDVAHPGQLNPPYPFRNPGLLSRGEPSLRLPLLFLEPGHLLEELLGPLRPASLPKFLASFFRQIAGPPYSPRR